MISKTGEVWEGVEGGEVARGGGLTRRGARCCGGLARCGGEGEEWEWGGV